jgi:hypothetical protein
MVCYISLCKLSGKNNNEQLALILFRKNTISLLQYYIKKIYDQIYSNLLITTTLTIY